VTVPGKNKINFKLMLIKRFEDAKVWQESQDLAVLIYESFRNCKDYSFRDQIQRAAISVSNNIAEGFERQTNKELINFLYISKGSCGEVRSMNYLSQKLGYVDNEKFELIKSKCFFIPKMTASFINSCK
jgi:four helix bundle protein